jgi:hypothetical protein
MEKKNLQKDVSVPRLVKGITLYLDGKVKPNGKGYYVEGNSGTYLVPESFESCECPDFNNPHAKPGSICKHIFAARLQKRMELKEAEICIDLEAKYQDGIKKLESKLREVAEENYKLRCQIEAFQHLREGFKQLIQSL